MPFGRFVALLLLCAVPTAASDLVSGLHTAMRDADTAVLQFKPIRAWGTMRHAMQLPIPWTLQAPLDIPANGRLELDLTVLDRLFGTDVATAAEPTRFRLTFTPEGGPPQVLLDRLVDPRGQPHDRGWLPQRVDLARFGGRRGTLELHLEVAGAPDRHGATFGLVSRPRIIDPLADRSRPNLLLVTIDALRADHLGCYGYHRPTSPALDRLATQGVRFAHAFSNAPMTVPSLPQLFTGRYFPPPDVQTLMSSLYASGMPATMAIVRNPYLTTFLTLDARDSFDRLLLRSSWRAPHISRAALDWIDHRDGEPWALYLHYLDTHTPYTLPEAAATRFIDPQHHGAVGTTFTDIRLARAGRLDAGDRQRVIDLYDGAIRYVDDYLGTVLDGLRERGLLDHTMVVVTADHGEELFDRGGFFHGQSLYDELLHVPLLVRFPGGAFAGRVIEPQVAHVDLFPSIADVLHLPMAPGVDGVSWMPLVHQEGVPTRPVLARAANPERPWRFAARLPTHKLILTVDPFEEQLFDLAVDPGERHNRLDDPTQAPALAALRLLLADFRAPLATRGYQLRAIPHGAGPVDLEVRVHTTEAAPIANPDRVESTHDDRLRLSRDGLTLTWRARIAGAPQGVRFDRMLNAAGASEATLTVDMRVDGRRVRPDALRIGGPAMPADGVPLAVHTAPPRPFAPPVETPSLAAVTPPRLEAPTDGPVRLYLWRSGDGGSGGVAPAPVDAEQRERLRALGYAD